MQSHPFTLRRTLKYVLILLLCVMTAAYLSYQARFLITGPVLTLTNEPEIVHNDRTVTLSGTADHISHVTLNGRPMYTDTDGNFTQTLVLENGYTIATIRAYDRYGRTATIERPFVYRPASFIE